MRSIQIYFSIGIFVLLFSCSGGKDQQQEQQKEPTLPAQEMKEVTARFYSFELQDLIYITFFDQQRERWTFQRCNFNECNFGIEAEVSNMENQGWETNQDLIGKWFDLTYQYEEQQFPDGEMGEVMVIVGFSLNEELNDLISTLEEDLAQTIIPRKLSYTLNKMESNTIDFMHMGQTNPERTCYVLSDYVGGGVYSTSATTKSAILKLDDLSSGGSEMAWSEDGQFVAINGQDLYAGGGTFGLIMIHVPSGQYAELDLRSLKDEVNFEGRKSLELENISWTSDNACLFTLNINFEGESGHPGINGIRQAELGSNFGKDDPMLVGYFQIETSIGDVGSFVVQQSNSNGITIESYELNDNNGTQSKLPHLNDTLNPESPSMAKINKTILDQFYLSEYQINPDGYDFIKIKFSSELNEDIAYIAYRGQYYGRSISMVQAELYFDLETGEQLVFDPISFHTYFKPESYGAFLTTYWIEGVNKAFEEAVLCAGTEPYCSKFDIASCSIESDQLTFSLTSDCFPSAAASCAPSFSVTLSLDSLESYFNVFGKSALIDDNILSLMSNSYFYKTGLEKYEYLINNEQLILENSWELEIVTDDF
jgi:hypothetical protein